MRHSKAELRDRRGYACLFMPWLDKATAESIVEAHIQMIIRAVCMHLKVRQDLRLPFYISLK